MTQVPAVSPAIQGIKNLSNSHNCRISKPIAVTVGPDKRKLRCFMIANLTSGLDFHSKALVLRAERQRVIASNIANADTPGYVARDLNFKEAMNNAIGGSLTGGLTASKSSSQERGSSANDGTTNARHIP